MEAMFGHLISTGPAEALIASVWQGLCLTVLAWISLKLAPGLRASTRFILWSIVFMLIALLPFFFLTSALLTTHSLPEVSGSSAGFSLHLSNAWAYALQGLWLLASLFSLAKLVWSGLQMKALLRNSAPVADLGEEIQLLLERPGKRPVEVRLSDEVDAPSAVGFFRPAVVMPTSLWSELSTSELKQIVQHEVAHLNRGDDWTNLLQKLLRALFPLNPALIWAERHLCVERELACDDAVLDAAGNARAYATCLTNLAEKRMVRRVASLAPGMWQRQSELAGRVQNILHRRRVLRPIVSGTLIAGTLLASLCSVFFLQRCPGVIKFANNEVVAAAAPVQTIPVLRDARNLNQARYQEATFHPAVSAPKPHASQPANTARQIQLLQIREDMDGQGITLVLYTVEVRRTAPQTSTAVTIPDNWFTSQI
jgi:beta-lactamase regulating signal transducer with metallopeptidase domain